MSYTLEGRTALVSGGAGGIGRAISLALAKEGAKVIILCRDQSKADLTIRQIHSSGGKGEYHLIDLMDPSARERGINDILSENAVDILVNNAGISGFMGPVTKTALKELDNVMEINLKAPFHLAQLVLPGMEERRFGRIINISSVACRVNPPFSVTYNVSKAALNSFTASLSREVAASGITVNALAPGLVLTERILKKRLPGLASEKGISEEELKQSMKSRSDTKELTSEGELAETVLFLCSSGAKNLTGEVIELSGGYQG